MKDSVSDMRLRSGWRMRLRGNTTQTKGNKADRPCREDITMAYVDREVQRRPTAVVAIEGLKRGDRKTPQPRPPHGDGRRRLEQLRTKSTKKRLKRGG